MVVIQFFHLSHLLVEVMVALLFIHFVVVEVVMVIPVDLVAVAVQDLVVLFLLMVVQVIHHQ
jgi:hypothetical protein